MPGAGCQLKRSQQDGARSRSNEPDGEVRRRDPVCQAGDVRKLTACSPPSQLSLRELKHFSQDAKDRGKIGGTEDAEPLPEALAVNRAQLIESHSPFLTAKPTSRAEGIGVPTRSHRRNNDGTQMVIELIGRDDQTRPSLANLATARRIQFNEHDLAPVRNAGETSYRHSHSSSSNAGGGVSSSPSSPRWCSCAAASAHPARARRTAAMTIRPLSA